jgi:hypothetical protein
MPRGGRGPRSPLSTVNPASPFSSRASIPCVGTGAVETGLAHWAHGAIARTSPPSAASSSRTSKAERRTRLIDLERASRPHREA